MMSSPPQATHKKGTFLPWVAHELDRKIIWGVTVIFKWRSSSEDNHESLTNSEPSSYPLTSPGEGRVVKCLFLQKFQSTPDPLTGAIIISSCLPAAVPLLHPFKPIQHSKPSNSHKSLWNWVLIYQAPNYSVQPLSYASSAPKILSSKLDFKCSNRWQHNQAQARESQICLNAYRDVQEEKAAVYYLCQERLDHRRGETDRWHRVRRWTDI